MTDINALKDNFVVIFNQLFSSLGIEHKFMCEVPESSLNSVSEYSVLVGISGSYEGNIMFGFTKEPAIAMTAALMGTKNVNTIDFNVKAALADLFYDFAERVVSMSMAEESILLSNPAFITGQEMKAVISKAPAINLFFKIKGEKFSVSYYLAKM